MLSFDQTVESWLSATRTTMGVKSFTLIAYLGQWELVIAVSAVISVIFWFLRKRNYIFPFLLALIGSELTGIILKKIIQRPRPLGMVYPESTFSFPSGHALISVAFFGFLIYFVRLNIENKFWKNMLTAIFIILILAVGFSRLYLGMHYFSDVIAGYAVGLVWLWIAIWTRKKIVKP